ncbi:MAG: hypothetical protein RR614_05030, partial [Eubacterium sp.]
MTLLEKAKSGQITAEMQSVAEHEGVTPATAEAQASSPEQKPQSTGASTPEPTEAASVTLMDAEKKS